MGMTVRPITGKGTTGCRVLMTTHLDMLRDRLGSTMGDLIFTLACEAQGDLFAVEMNNAGLAYFPRRGQWEQVVNERGGFLLPTTGPNKPMMVQMTAEVLNQERVVIAANAFQDSSFDDVYVELCRQLRQFEWQDGTTKPSGKGKNNELNDDAAMSLILAIWWSTHHRTRMHIQRRERLTEAMAATMQDTWARPVL